ncbi:short-chain dehydrogenase [Pseudoxanthomonas sp. Root65]|uniref:SDR family oxidoreductase n=1 Tax=Pseudoxanthomonas sp. Root65 TaxID=1736576 RepID=UPI0006FE6D20|nr:SDR family oxidoreductase [Pseudoxanthomonas sp. Root65]KRA53777.1 short-chain dehydrogenase [Pseudoxanthomonas sp. Root65]
MHRRRSHWTAMLAMAGALLLSACTASGTVAQPAPRPDWSAADMPSQAGRIFVVTGGTSGIGLESARALAAAGAEVIIAARNPQRGEEAIAGIRQQSPGANVRFEALDLGDLASVHALGNRLAASLPRLDGLINNAGVMEPPQRDITPDGFESQFAINYLGHFALTADLLPLLRKSDAPRVVTLSSIAARRGALHFDDLQFEREWDTAAAYRQSKLACLMFARELQRRSDAQGWGITSIASHPGLSRTNLLPSQGRSTPLWRFFQTAERGAVPTLYAATAQDAQGGRYYGPTGLLEARGALGHARVPDAATDAEAAARLWDVSETLSGVHYPSGTAE